MNNLDPNKTKNLRGYSLIGKVAQLIEILENNSMLKAKFFRNFGVYRKPLIQRILGPQKGWY